MSTELQNLSAPPIDMNSQMRKIVYPIPSIPMQNAGKVSNMLINRTFIYWSIFAGFGLVVMGSILTYIFQEQAPYSRDPFRSSLQITSAIFIVIGVLLITSSVIKISSIMLSRNGSESKEGCLCCSDDFADDNVKTTSAMPENTIVYNPFYPPILIPYNMSSVQYPGNDFTEQSQHDPNFSYLPGSLFVGENQEMKKQVLETVETCSNLQPKPNIFVLENLHVEEEEEEEEAEEEDEEDIVQTAIKDEKSNEEKCMTTNEKENTPSMRY